MTIEWTFGDMQHFNGRFERPVSSDATFPMPLFSIPGNVSQSVRTWLVARCRAGSRPCQGLTNQDATLLWIIGSATQGFDLPFCEMPRRGGGKSRGAIGLRFHVMSSASDCGRIPHAISKRRKGFLRPGRLISMLPSLSRIVVSRNATITYTSQHC